MYCEPVDSAERIEEIKECKSTGAGKGRKEGRKEINYIMDVLDLNLRNHVPN